MLDYLAHTPTPVHADFDLVTMFEEVKAATLLDINYCGPATMHADRGMMFRIMLNLGRNAGTAGASALSIDIWRAGHLAIMDISDNGSGILRHLWPSLFSPFKSRQSTSGGLGLSIARDLALAQDGILKLSRSSDVGSEFRIQFHCVKFPEMAHEGVSTNWPSVPIGSHARDSASAILTQANHTRRLHTRRPMIGVDGCGSMSHGKKIHVSCDTSVTNVSTNGRPAGLA